MAQDLLEVLRKKIGCNYISDLRFHKKDVLTALEDFPFSDFSSKEITDMIQYIWG